MADEDDFRSKRKARARAAAVLPKRFVELANKCMHELDIIHNEALWTLEQVNELTDWPEWADPMQFMSRERACRKRQQLANIILAVKYLMERNVVPQNAVIADLCSGSGHLGFALAAQFPEISVVLVEINATAAETARKRVDAMNQNRVRVLEQSVLEFDEPCDVVVALHACGMLSDIAHLHAVKRQAAYVLCPCCVGKVQVMHEKFKNRLVEKQLVSEHKRDTLFPRSDKIAKILSQKEFYELARHADYSEWDEKKLDSVDSEEDEEQEEKKTKNTNSTDAAQRRLCKSIVELDRNWSAENYMTFLLKMTPLTCTPKNEILLGFVDKKER